MANIKNIPWQKVLLHVVAWIIVLSMPYLLRYDPGNRMGNPDEQGFFFLGFFTSLFWIPLFYFNYYVLTPRFIYRRKYSLFTLALLGTYLAVILVHSWMFHLFVHVHRFRFMNGAWFNLFPFLLAVAASTSIRQAQDRTNSDKLMQQRQEENLKTELSFLRSQISPHFMFNVLNNMLAMARLKSDQLESTILKLSSLMRYILYEADEEKVLLKKEVEYLQSYIDLQRQRIGGKVAIKVNMQTGEEEYTIAPMLLIPFIENAFKHSTASVSQPVIEIELHTSHNMLYCRVANTFNRESIEIKDKTAGIGLQNVKRRLNLLYGNRYSLLINDIDNWFTVSLQLNLQPL